MTQKFEDFLAEFRIDTPLDSHTTYPRTSLPPGPPYLPRYLPNSNNFICAQSNECRYILWNQILIWRFAFLASIEICNN